MPVTAFSEPNNKEKKTCSSGFPELFSCAGAIPAEENYIRKTKLVFVPAAKIIYDKR